MVGIAQLPPVEFLNPFAVNSFQFAGFGVAVYIVDDAADYKMFFAAAWIGCSPFAQQQLSRVNPVHE